MHPKSMPSSFLLGVAPTRINDGNNRFSWQAIVGANGIPRGCMSLPQGPPLHLLVRQSWGPSRLLLDVTRQSRWILKQRCFADFEVYAKRIRHSAHLIKYLEAFMPNDGHKAQSNKVQAIFMMWPPKGSDNKTFPQRGTKLMWLLGKTEWLLATLISMEECGQTKVNKTKGTKEVS